MLPTPQFLIRNRLPSDVNGEGILLPLTRGRVLHAFPSPTQHIPNDVKFNLLGLASIGRSSLHACKRTSPQNCAEKSKTCGSSIVYRIIQRTDQNVNLNSNVEYR